MHNIPRRTRLQLALTQSSIAAITQVSHVTRAMAYLLETLYKIVPG